MWDEKDEVCLEMNEIVETDCVGEKITYAKLETEAINRAYNEGKKAGLESAAKVCEEVDGLSWKANVNGSTHTWKMGINDCIERIRALLREVSK